MQINLNPEALSKAIESSAMTAVEAALKSFQTQKAISEVISTEIMNGAIREALQNALTKVDTVALTQHLAAEIQRASTKAVVSLLEEGLTSVVCKIRGISESEFDNEAKQKRAAVRAELFQKG